MTAMLNDYETYDSAEHTASSKDVASGWVCLSS